MGKHAMPVQSIYARVGERLRVLREMRGESQDAVGKLLGWTRAAVSNVEAGRTRLMLHDLVVLAEHFGVKLAALVAHDARGGRS